MSTEREYPREGCLFKAVRPHKNIALINGRILCTYIGYKTIQLSLMQLLLQANCLEKYSHHRNSIILIHMHNEIMYIYMTTYPISSLH